jgi:hypothetical protein
MATQMASHVSTGLASHVATESASELSALRTAELTKVHVTDMPGLSFAFGRSRDDRRHRKRISLRSTHFDSRRQDSRSLS